MSESGFTAEQIAVYRRSARRLREQDRAAELARREKAWQLAREAAALLKAFARFPEQAAGPAS